MFAASFGSSVGEAYYDSRCDLDNDGDVDFSDFILFARNFGKKA